MPEPSKKTKRNSKKLFKVLVKKVVKNNSPETYKNTGIPLGIHYRHMAKPLGLIQDFCEENNLPKLVCLVVRSDTKLPGGGCLFSDKKVHKKQLKRLYKNPKIWKNIEFNP